MKRLVNRSGAVLAAALLIIALSSDGPALPSLYPFVGGIGFATPLLLLAPELQP